MAKKKDAVSDSSESQGRSFPLRLLSRLTWHELIAIPLVGAAVAIYWFRATLLDLYFTSQTQVLTFLSLGLLPLLVWVAVLAWALKYKLSWFRQYRLWIASVGLLAITIGAMSFFQPANGVMGWFALGGTISLGGYVGELIVGSVLWLGVLRLVGIALVSFAIAAPTLAADLAVGLGRLFVYAYVSLVLVARWIGGMYRKDTVASPAPQASNDDGYATDNGYVKPDALSLDYRMRSIEESDPTLVRNEPRVPQFSGSIISTSAPYTKDNYESESQTDTNGYIEDDYETDEPQVAEPMIQPMASAVEMETEDYSITASYPETNGVDSHKNGDSEADSKKFNRFWDSEQSGQPQPETSHVNGDTAPQNGAGEQNHRPTITVSLLGKRKEQWIKPSIDMLENVPDQGISEKQIMDTAHTIQKTLADYGIEVEVGEIRPGPTVTMYGLIPGWIRKYKQVKKTDANGQPVLDEKGKQIVNRVEQKTRVKVDSILSREKDLALALKTPSIRIETPVMGKSQVGIEIPNSSPSPVTLRGVMESKEFQNLRKKAHLPVAFGKGSGGETEVIDLAKMPHLLIAGATGSGKSVCLNTIVSCLIMEKSPAELRLLLIDPKRVELTPYNGIPHLLNPVVVEVDKVVGLLKGVIKEMMDRYRQMEEVGVRNIEAYNKRFPEEKMPFLLVVVDELADLMMTAAFDVEQSLCRLAQLGRATGIHLIVATQRPSVDVVTGLIKANFPSRVSFGVTSYIDSRTILDTTGAEKLLGRGDMLYLPLDASRPVRIQGVYISDREIESLVNYWQITPRGWMPQMSIRQISDEESGGDVNGVAKDSTDELFDKAVELAQTHTKLSTSLLQRRLRIGYPRAARLMDELEDQGIVGPSDGSKSRDVIMNNV